MSLDLSFDKEVRCLKNGGLSPIIDEKQDS